MTRQDALEHQTFLFLISFTKDHTLELGKMNSNNENLRRRVAFFEQKNLTLQCNLDAQTVEVNQLTNLYSKLKQEYAIIERDKEIIEQELQEALE